MKTQWLGMIAAALLLIGCNKEANKGYVPIAAFEPSYKALQGAEGNDYNIEETVRVLNGLELAQAQSEDFDAYLEYMARQDYSQVAQEVVDLQVQLLPTLQEMYMIDQEYENLNLWTSLGRDLSADLSQMATQPLDQNTTANQVHSLLRFALAPDALLPGMIAVSAVARGGEKVFDTYEK